jgi:tRNA (cytidine/uridine-2'-O-)-methyltransferase
MEEAPRQLHTPPWKGIGGPFLLPERKIYDPDVFHLILYQPEIPPNTGNIIRLCANVGASLHLIHPLGFELDDARLRRAGLDYRELALVREHASLESCLSEIQAPRLFALTTRGSRSLFAASFVPGDGFLLGPETRGLPESVLESVPERARLRIPLRPANRSLNVSNAAAVALYEAWRQAEFEGGY